MDETKERLLSGLGFVGLAIWEIIQVFVVALAIFVVVYLFLFQPHQVKGNSMLPNFHDTEYILTDKVSYKIGLPKRGDVVVFKAPLNQQIDYIKRVIALPGEKVKIEGGSIYINELKLKEKYLPSDFYTSGGAFAQEGLTFVVPPGEYFCVGDNRNHSSDSREWGTVKLNLIIGKSFLRYLPINKFGLITRPNYQ